jgi:hypothetical protein
MSMPSSTRRDLHTDRCGDGYGELFSNCLVRFAA